MYWPVINGNSLLSFFIFEKNILSAGLWNIYENLWKFWKVHKNFTKVNGKLNGTL